MMLHLLFLSMLTFALICESRPHCTPMKTDFRSPGSSLPSSFKAMTPSDSYAMTKNGLELYLKPPMSQVTTTGRVNSELGAGATINSTYTYLYGKVTFDIAAPAVKGVVTAVINIGETAADEVDIEILGSDARHWQTNVFVPSEEDPDPHFGELSSIEPLSNTISESHKYTIDWSPERIIWSIDGKAVRTLRKEDTRLNGVLHYPTNPSRLQLGIWDGSSPVGTSEWAGGPIDWDKSRGPIAAVVRSVEVECP